MFDLFSYRWNIHAARNCIFSTAVMPMGRNQTPPHCILLLRLQYINGHPDVWFCLQKHLFADVIPHICCFNQLRFQLAGLQTGHAADFTKLRTQHRLPFYVFFLAFGAKCHFPSLSVIYIKQMRCGIIIFFANSNPHGKHLPSISPSQPPC